MLTQHNLKIVVLNLNLKKTGYTNLLELNFSRYEIVIFVDRYDEKQTIKCIAMKFL